MRRASPRPAAVALRQVMSAAAPATVLARVQASWPGAVGPAVAAEAEPVGEREGVVTVACRSSVWAQELQLLGPDILDRLNEALEPGGGRPLKELRVRTAWDPGRGPAAKGGGFP